MLAAVVSRILPYKAAALGLVFAALALTVFAQSVRLQAARASLSAKTETVDTLGRLMAAQNAGIQAIAADATRRETLAAKAVASAKTLQKRASARVASIEAAPVPTDCQGAMQWLVTEGQKLEGQQ